MRSLLLLSPAEMAASKKEKREQGSRAPDRIFSKRNRTKLTKVKKNLSNMPVSDYATLESMLAHVVGLSEHEHQFQLHKAPMNDGLS
jgi:hypothetical protein